MENLWNIVYGIVLAGWSMKHPDRFVIGYLVYVSLYFGWMNGNILIGGVDYGQFLFNVLALVPVILSWKDVEPPLKKVILLFALFYLYGLAKPVFDGHQGWMLSVKSSKSMTTYFFLFYVLAFYKRLNGEKIFRFLTCLSLYYTLLYILNKMGVVIRPPFYIKESFIQCPYDSFLLLALCYQLTKENVYSIRRLGVITLLLIGIYIGGYFSLTLASLGIIVGVFLFRSVRHPALVVLLTCTLLLVLLDGWLIDSTFKTLWSGQQSALESRSHYNEFRWALIAKEFWGGYGFLSRDTRLVSLNAAGDTSSYMSDLSFIDAGYVDLMGRFGLIGTILFLTIPLYFLWISPKNLQTIPFLLLVVTFYAVNMTWSVFSYPQGIIVLAGVYAKLYQNHKTKCKWQES